MLKATAAAAPLVGAGLVSPSTALAWSTRTGRRPRGHVLVPRAGRWIDPDPHALAKRAVDAAMAAGAHYADARLTIFLKETWFEGSATTPWENAELYGIGVRALYNGCWGFFASAVWTPDEAVRLGQSAVAQARTTARGSSREVSLSATPPVTNGVWTMPVKYDPFTVPLAEKADYMDTVRGLLHRSSTLVTGAMTATFQRTQKYFASSEGSSWAQTTYVTEGGVNVRYDAELGYYKYMAGWSTAATLTPAGQGWEYIAESGIPEQLPALVELAAAARDVVPFDVGRYDLVCEPLAVGTFLSNSIGAATELDRAMGFEANAEGTSFLDQPLEMLGRYQIGSSLLNVSANRSQRGGAATVQWDDEGVVPNEFPIVTNGVLTDFQTTREQSAWIAPYYEKIGKPALSHGCASSESALNVTLQHPPNFRLKGAAKHTTFDDLVAGTEKGIALLDANWRMDHQCLNGIGFGLMREIKKGKLGRVIDGGVMSIRAPEMWKNLVALGSDDTTQWIGVQRHKGEPEQTSYHSVGVVPAKFSNVAVVNLMGSL
jgi:TldD protein